MTRTLRLDLEAMLREKAKRFREVADLFDRAAEAPTTNDRGIILDKVGDVLDDIKALSEAAREEEVTRVMGEEASVSEAQEVDREHRKVGVVAAEPLRGYVLACKDCAFTADPAALATPENQDGLREAWFAMATHRFEHEDDARVEAWKEKHHDLGHVIEDEGRLVCECGERFVNSLGLP